MEPPLIALDHVSRAFDGGRVTALHDVSLSLRRGELVALHGPSGSGKTTLLNMMSGLDVPTSGATAFEGRAHLRPSEWTRLRAARIGLVFQDFNLLPTLTASENVEVAMFGRVWRAAERRRRAQDRLAEVGVAHCAGRLPQQLSGGERRRVGVARSLANAPELLLADEPTSNLDTATGATVADLLLDLHRRHGMTLVIVTHDSALIERCGRRIRLVDGRVAEDESAAEAMAA